jgi:hypothetical protein
MTLGWGATPSNRRACKRCGEPVAWVLLGNSRHRVFIQPEPDPGGTILVLNDGTHLADLENPSHFPLDPDRIKEARAELVKQGYRLYRRHSRVCGAPKVRGEPISLNQALDRRLEELQTVIASA